MSFARLRAADWVAFVAALALLFATAADWYSTEGGRQAREFEQGAPARGEGAELADDAAAVAEGEERNAWQADGAIDRAILVALLGTAAFAILAAFARAAGRRSEDGVGPTAWAGTAAALTALLVLYRVIQEPGFDEVNTVQYGAPLALGLLGLIAFACAMSVRAEEQDEEGTELREVNAAT
jgi:drug/metabolite transporter (DMT)-like permease